MRRSMSPRCTSSDSAFRSARSSMRAISSRRARSSSGGTEGHRSAARVPIARSPPAAASSRRRQGNQRARVAIRFLSAGLRGRHTEVACSRRHVDANGFRGRRIGEWPDLASSLAAPLFAAAEDPSPVRGP